MLIVDSNGRLVYWSNPKVVDYITDTNWCSNSIKKLSYDDVMRVVSQYPKLTGIAIYTLHELDAGAMSGLTGLKSLNMKSIEKMGDWALSGDISLAQLTCNTVKNLGKGVFCGCESLVSVDISRASDVMAESLFEGCRSLTAIMDLYEAREFQERCLAGCSKLNIDLDEFKRPGEHVTLSVAQDAWLGVKITTTDIKLGGEEEGLKLSSGGTGLFANQASIRSFKAGTGGFDPQSNNERLLSNCQGLSVFDGGDMPKIGAGELASCKSLLSVSFPGATSFDETIDGSVIPPLYGSDKLRNVSAPNLNGKCLYLDGTDVSAVGFTNATQITSTTTADGKQLYGFRGCKNLVSVQLGIEGFGFDRIQSVGPMAFADCANLLSVIVGPDVMEIDSTTFLNDAGKLKLISVDLESMSYASKLSDETSAYGSDVLFDLNARSIVLGCANSILSSDPANKANGTGAKDGHVKVASIGDYAFYGVDRFNYPPSTNAWYLGSQISAVGKYAFAGVKGLDLTQMFFDGGGASLLSIGDYAFANTTDGTAKSMTLTSLSSVGDCAFLGSSLLSEVKSATKLSSVGVSAFAATPMLTKFDMTTQTFTKIGDYAFAESGIPTQAKPVKMSLSLSNDLGAGSHAFENCKNIGALTFTKNVFGNPTGDHAYAGTNISKVTVDPNTVYPRYPQRGMMENCGKLASTQMYVSMFDTVPDEMFNGCSVLTDIAVPVKNVANYWKVDSTQQDNIKYVGSRALSGCAAMKAIGFSGILNRWQMEPDALEGSQLLSVCFNKMEASELTSTIYKFWDPTYRQLTPENATYGVWYDNLADAKKFCEENGIPLVAVIDVKNHSRCCAFRHRVFLSYNFQKFVQIDDNGFPAVFCYVRLPDGRWAGESAEAAKEMVGEAEKSFTAGKDADYPYVLYWWKKKSGEYAVKKCVQDAYMLADTQYPHELMISQLSKAFGETVPARDNKVVKDNDTAAINQKELTFGGWGIGHDCMFGAYVEVESGKKKVKQIQWFDYNASRKTLIARS